MHDVCEPIFIFFPEAADLAINSLLQDYASSLQMETLGKSKISSVCKIWVPRRLAVVYNPANAQNCPRDCAVLWITS